jgi:hypothetical protein
LQPLRTKGERQGRQKAEKVRANSVKKKDKIFAKKFAKSKSPSIFATASESKNS